MSEAKTFQDWVALDGVKEGDVFVCVEGRGSVYTKDKVYVVISIDGTLALTDNLNTEHNISYCRSTAAKFIKKQNEEKKMSKLLKTNWSLEWTKENATAIIKTLVAVGVPVYWKTVDNPEESQFFYSCLASRGDYACGYYGIREHHFKHLEDFLAWYFKPEKSAKEVIENLESKVEELKAQVAKLKGVM